MAELHGENSAGDSVSRCPGENQCPRWDNQAGSYEDKVQATLGCDRCNGVPPILNQSNSPESIKKKIVARIENFVRQDNAKTLNLNLLDYLDWKLIEIWRDEEVHHERLFKIHSKIIYQALTREVNG